MWSPNTGASAHALPDRYTRFFGNRLQSSKIWKSVDVAQFDYKLPG